MARFSLTSCATTWGPLFTLETSWSWTGRAFTRSKGLKRRSLNEVRPRCTCRRTALNSTPSRWHGPGSRSSSATRRPENWRPFGNASMTSGPKSPPPYARPGSATVGINQHEAAALYRRPVLWGLLIGPVILTVDEWTSEAPWLLVSQLQPCL